MTRILFALVAVASVAAAAPRPLYYDREITNADLDGRSLRELSIMRNWPFAKAGQPFRKQWLRDYFSALPWYKPVDIKEVKKLSNLDSKNAAAIAKYETALSRDELRKRRDEIGAGKLGVMTPSEVKIESMLLSRLLGGRAVPEEKQADPATSPLDDPSQLDRLLTVDQLKDMSRRDLRVLRNMVYARRGRKFKSQLLQSYFDRMEWYSIDPDYGDNKLTKNDQRNIKLIRSVEDSIGGPMTDDEQKQEDGWFVAA